MDNRIRRLLYRAAVKVAWYEVREGIDWPGCWLRLIRSLFGLARAAWFAFGSLPWHRSS